MKKFLKTLAVFAAVAALGFGFDLVLMMMMVQVVAHLLLLHTLARILMVKLTPLVFTAITPMQCT